MARTRLFGQLRRIAARALASRAPASLTLDAESGHLTRRQLTLGALQLAAVTALPACNSDDDGKRRPGGERVAVVGAGIAGLHCAYRLQQAGVDVTVYEASTRVGGRMFTAREKTYDDQTFELGGELIDSNHATMFALAKELDITLDDRLGDDGIQPDVWWVNGAEIPEETIVTQFSAVAPLMADAMAAADDADDSSVFDDLDATSLADWLAENVPASDYAELNAILGSAYRGEFGLELDEQSALNLIYLIGSEEPDPFRIFGDSDERYHAREGSDAFPTRLYDKLSEGTVSFNSKLTALSGGNERGFILEITDSKSGTKREDHFDYVVIALPYSVLRKVSIDVPLSDLKRQIIDELGYGTNAKIMGQYDARVWREEHAKSGTVTADLPLQQLWDSSIGQPGKRGILTNFLGGQAGLDVGDGDAEDYYVTLLPDIDTIFPGSQDAYRAGSARRMHWPSHEFTRGSYTCYKPGQWQFFGHEGEPEGNVFFCGEHTSADFQGWMEGGAETGARVAKEVLNALNIPLPKALEELVGTEAAPATALPRAQLKSKIFPRHQLLLQKRVLATRVRSG